MLNVKLNNAATNIGTVVVSASKFEQKLSEVVVSMNVVKPQLIENQNQTSLTGVMEQVPGVTIVDNQANIRGGSGFSYAITATNAPASYGAVGLPEGLSVNASPPRKMSTVNSPSTLRLT